MKFASRIKAISLLAIIVIGSIATSAFSGKDLKETSVLYTDINKSATRPTPRFSFVHLTDVHIGEGALWGDYGSKGVVDTPDWKKPGDPALRLMATVRWINQNHRKENIRFVMVTGDLTDSGEQSEFMMFKAIMDSLEIPYVPLMGNHDIWPYTHREELQHPEGDVAFNALFRQHFEKLKTTFDAWDDGTRLGRCLNQEAKQYCYLQNYSFQYEGYLFLLADFATRKHANWGNAGIGPEAQLMDFEGGSWQWVKQKVKAAEQFEGNNILFFSHFPLLFSTISPINAFSAHEFDLVTRYFEDYKTRIGPWFAGHIHRNKDYPVTRRNQAEIITRCIETAANKEYPYGHIRVVRAH